MYDRELVSRLPKHGTSVSVVSLDPNKRSEAARLLWTLNRSSPDVVVIDELCHREAAVQFSWPSFGKRKPKQVLLVHHLTEWEDTSARASEWLSLRGADLVIATSRTSAVRLFREQGVTAAVCEPGCDRLPLDAPPTSRPPGSEATLRFLFVGTWTARKGLVELLDALEALGDARYALTIVGDSARDRPYRERVLKTLRLCPSLARRCEIMGKVDDAELARQYQRSDVLVLPSHFEGYGMVLSEAVRAGLGIVTTRVGAIPEVVRDGQEAVLVKSGRGALRDALAELIANPGRVEEMKRYARKRRFPSWDESAARFAQLLEQALSRDA